MKHERILGGMAAILLACSVAAPAQDKGYWRASNSTAQSVTGDVGLSDVKLMINFVAYNIVQARELQPAEVSAVFDADSNAGKKGVLYKLNIPATRKLMHKNTLCGGEDTQWMASYVDGNMLHLAFFSGEKVPTFTLDAISNSTSLCGTFAYTR